jgi:peptidylprolyl isomerase
MKTGGCHSRPLSLTEETAMAQVKQGDRVKIHYTGRFPDGTVFDSSREREPLEFEAGSAELIPGVSNAVVGMSEGEQRTVSVPPVEGYGERDEQMVQEVPCADLPEGVTVGDALRAQAGDQEFQVWVKELDDEKAVIDGNHPLAGHTLEFELEVVEVVA